MAGNIAARRRAHGTDCVHLDYPQATHALSFLAPDDTASPDDVARRAAWPQLLEFLRSCTP
jgi:hypothetical protein